MNLIGSELFLCCNQNALRACMPIFVVLSAYLLMIHQGTTRKMEIFDMSFLFVLHLYSKQ